MLETVKKDRARFVSRMFGRIARRYDMGNRVLSLGRDQAWRRRAIAALAPQAGERILDAGAGTGDLSLAVAGVGASVYAADLCLPMLIEGRRKASRAGLEQPIAFLAADALRLPFPDAAFDGAITAFTIRNFARLDDGLRELRRVLRPQGRLVCLEFMRPQSNLVSSLYRPYLTHVLPTLGGIITGDRSAYVYLAESIGDFSTPKGLADSLLAAGFGSVRYDLLNLGTVAIHVAGAGEAQ